jgi:hypothetical protein
MANEQRGFAGFDSLVSDVSDLAPPRRDAKPAARSISTADDDDEPVWIPPPKPRKRPTKWIVAAVVVAGLIVVGILGDKRSSSSPVVGAEEKPPIGEGMVLSISQLRYCLAQSARIDGANKTINAASQVDIDRFNALVDDFNSRCAKARYRTSTMQSVRAEVDARRAQLEQEGAAVLGAPYAR